MAFIVADRVQETATANTTVSFTLSGAIASYQSFSAIGNGNTTYYGATDGTNWEVGLGAYSTSPNTLTRTTILSSSNSGAAVTFSGAVTVWCDYPAGKQISSDYPNALGVVTPAAGTFTTITGQTEVLKGTGQNLIFYSQALATSPWGTSSATVTNNAGTDPLGGNTATSISASAQKGGPFQAITVKGGLTYTYSVWMKLISGNSTGVGMGYFDNTNSTQNPSTSTITTTWTRYTYTFTVASNTTLITLQLYDNNTSGFGTFYAWGAQLELASSVGTYLQTTSAAIYGTPTLSFSGVAGLGLQSDGSLYVSPAGTGALQAQKTDSTATGGNARGANAVDWQTTRGNATNVASAPQSVLVGGGSNIASGQYSSVLGGIGVTSSGFAATSVGGWSNTTSGTGAFVGGGRLNASAGYWNFIGGGFTNSGTANAAVTTQSGTMNGTTAVTLSGSNASIKVGQYIAGTSINTDTYVAAISGTSLTLSQAASGSSTSTLSFYTPHGVVVGGGNNQATGSYSFIGGGGDAGTAANRNTASGGWSAVVGGRNNIASGAGSFIGGGGYYDGLPSATNNGNTASGDVSSILGGLSHSTVGFASSSVGGQGNYVNGTHALSLGNYATTRGIQGYLAISPNYSPLGTFTVGVSQGGIYILSRQTTDATATVLTGNTSAAGGTNQVILPNNSAYYFTGEVISGVTGGGNSKGWTISGVIKRGANAGATTLVGSTVTSLYADAGAATWTIGLTADTTNGGLAVTFTGQAATTIRTVCRISSVEMTF